MAKMRLDKLLGNMGHGSRSEIKKWAKLGLIAVNGKIEKDSGKQVDAEHDSITLDGEEIKYRKYVYIMLHKPPGVISATEDNRERTVIDLLSEEMQVFEPFPVGRLDKDTEGLLLLSNDGKLAHELLSPRKHVAKTYYAHIAGYVDESDIEAFANGVTLDDGYQTMSAKLVITGREGDGDSVLSLIEVTIMEGKYHQVKRMFEAVGKQVVYLKRLSMGKLVLDPELAIGHWRELTSSELSSLQSHSQA